MQKLIAILLLSTLLSGCVLISSYTKEDYQRQSAYSVAHIVDWRQTVRIAKQPEVYHELNPLLGRHPSIAAVHAYMAGTLLLNWYVVDKLPREYKKPYQYFILSVEGGVVLHNFLIGLGLL